MDQRPVQIEDRRQVAMGVEGCSRFKGHGASLSQDKRSNGQWQQQ